MRTTALFALCFCLLHSCGAAQPEQLRGIWVDAWRPGIKSEPEVRQLVKDVRAAHFNAVFAQVRRRGDAFYQTTLVPRAADTNITPADFDCLKALIEAAHDTLRGPRLEVHAWLVMYPASTSAHPTNSAHVLNAHPQWLSQTDLGTTFDGVGQGYWLDPGHPKVQAHLYDVVADLAKNYDVDGISLDHLRYPGPEWGYNATAVERFNVLNGRKGVPKRSDPEWSKFRRNQVTGLLRKIYLGLAEARPSLNLSVAGMTFSPVIGGAIGWTNSGAYIRSLQDWSGWAEQGIVDTLVPLVFFKSDAAGLQAFANWSDFARNNSHGRHVMISTGNYHNRVDEGLVQMRSALEKSSTGKSAQGVLWYSYGTPACENVSWAEIATALTGPRGLFAQAVSAPVMPWKSEPRHGSLKGYVRKLGSGSVLDGAIVRLEGPETNSTVSDGTGFYGFAALKTGRYSVIFEANDFSSATNTVEITAGAPRNLDGELRPQ